MDQMQSCYGKASSTNPCSECILPTSADILIEYEFSRKVTVSEKDKLKERPRSQFTENVLITIH